MNQINVYEEKLKESNARLSELIQSMASGILVEDENRTIVFANKEFCSIFEIPVEPQNLINTDCSNAAEQSKHLAADPEKFKSRINEILEQKKLVKNDEIVLRDGRVFERDYVPIFISDNYKGHLWNYRNITHRKQTEAALKESENYAHSLVAAIPELFFVLSKDGIFLDYKAEEKELYTRPDMFLNKNYKEVLPPFLSEVLESTIDNIYRNGSTVDINYSIPFPDQEKFYSGKAVPFGNDRIIFFVSNVTSQKLSERQLQRQNKLQSILMKISSQYINIPLNQVDKVINESLQIIGEFVEAHRSYIFNYDFEKQTTSNIFEWCSENIEPQIDNLQNVPLEFLSDWVKTHKAGKPMLVSDVMALPVDSGLRQVLEPQGIYTLITLPMMSGNECLGFVGFDWVGKFHVISETENQLLAVFAQLLVNINNRKEAETKLNIEKQNVEASNKALSDFAYIASHDLREPLRKISAFGSLLSRSLSGKLEKDDQENLNYMIEGAKRMQQMVDDLLFYSRITTKAKIYSVIDLDELLNELIHFDLSEMIKDTRADIIIENKLGLLSGERTQVKQLFQNLIGNGIKYRKKSVDPVVKIRSGRDHHFLEVQIEDNGIGIDEKYRDQIFEMFKRLHSKEEYEGSGIGLSVCKRITELYGGEIKVESELRKGSIFIFRLPVEE